MALTDRNYGERRYKTMTPSFAERPVGDTYKRGSSSGFSLRGRGGGGGAGNVPSGGSAFEGSGPARGLAAGRGGRSSASAASGLGSVLRAGEVARDFPSTVRGTSVSGARPRSDVALGRAGAIPAS